MAQVSTDTETVQRLAKLLEQDIRQRGLGPGDRYYTAAEAGAVMGVSTATANRALRVLAQRKLLVRRQNQGTFIAAGVQPPQVTVRTIHVLLEEDEPVWQTVRFDLLLQALRQVVGGVNVQVSFVPRQGALAYVQGLLGPVQTAGQLAGVVAISCSRDVYGYLKQSGIPTVVFGTLHDDQRRLVSIDSDWRESGRLLAEYLISNGHKRVALLTHKMERPGDNAFFDGLCDAVGGAGLSANAIVVRFLPPERSVVAAELERLLNDDWPVTGIIARSPRMLHLIDTAIASFDPDQAEKLEVVFEAHATEEIESAARTHTQSRLRFTEMATRIGELMRDVIDGRPMQHTRVVIPMELRRVAREGNGAA